MIFKRIYFYIKKEYKRYQFKKKAFIGEHFSCSHNSSCVNLSKERNRIRIGANCELCGDVHVDETGSVIIGDYTKSCPRRILL